MLPESRDSGSGGKLMTGESASWQIVDIIENDEIVECIYNGEYLVI